MAFGDFASTSEVLLPDVEYIIGQDVAKKYDYTTTVVHQVVPEIIDGTYDKRVYFHQDVVFRDKAQLKYSEITEYTNELIDSLDLSGKSVLLVDSTGVGEAVFDLYEAAGLNPLGIIFTGGESGSTRAQHNRAMGSTAQGIFGSISGYAVPKVDLVGALSVYVQHHRLRFGEGLRYAYDAEAQYGNFVGRINEKTKYVKYGNADDEVHDDIVVADAMCCWYTQHMNKSLKARPIEEFRPRASYYNNNPFKEDEEWL